MGSVGVRELKSRLSAYLSQVRKGERFVVTDRGRPVAILSPAAETVSDLRLEAILRSGLAKWGGGKPRGSARPPRSRGRSLADIVIEERG